MRARVFEAQWPLMAVWISPFLPLFSAATGLFSYQVHTARISPKGLSIDYCVSIRWLFNGNWMKAASIHQPHKTSDDGKSENTGFLQVPQLFPGVSLMSAQIGQGQFSTLVPSTPQDNGL